MEEFVKDNYIQNSHVLYKLNTTFTLLEEVLEESSSIFKDFLTFFLKKHGIHVNYSSKDQATQTTEVDIMNQSLNEWNTKTIEEDVTAVARQNLSNNGFIFDEQSGLYYDSNLQCYYNPEYRLYYNHQTAAYYYYDEVSKGLKYYCAASSGITKPCSSSNENSEVSEAIKSSDLSKRFSSDYKIQGSTDLKNERSTDFNIEEEIHSNKTGNKSIEVGSDKEEGECSDEDCDLPSSIQPRVIEAGPVKFEPNHAAHIAPCIRVLVISSLLQAPTKGTLFIITCTGATLGREGNHDILIPEELVSKLHCSFRYVYKDGLYFYELIDMGSKNGTYLNSKRLSQSQIQSDPVEITHGSILSVGSTSMLCHIHQGDETCKDCEGYFENPTKKTDWGNELTLRQKYSQELTSIRKKFGVNSYTVPKYPAGYEDRSEVRRKTVGSSHSSIKTEMASIDIPLNRTNKGFALMTKMGWIEGASLGKSDTGIIEPIVLEANEGTRGFGDDGSLKCSYMDVTESRKTIVSKKTRERFNQLELKYD